MKKVKILGSVMCRILNRIMCMIWTESNVNSVEMRTEEFLVKENRMRKREEVGKCEVHGFIEFKRSNHRERRVVKVGSQWGEFTEALNAQWM